MTEETQAHETSISMVKAALAEVDAGADMALRARVSCSTACDLRGEMVKLITQDAVVAKEIELAELDETGNETDEFVVKAPIEPGEYTWTAMFPAQEKEGTHHEESSAPFSFVARPHITSMAVWNVLSPIVISAELRLKVGVKCSAECMLMGKDIGIYDHEGVRVATGTLGDVPWPGATALYWAEVESEAPGTEGRYRWTARFPKPDLELPHEGASYPFVFVTVGPPEHMVTVEVFDRDTKTPVEKANVLLHPYRGKTDDNGVAEVVVTKGEYELNVTKGNYGVFQRTVSVDSDMTIKAEVWVVPPEPYDGGY